MPTGPEHYQQAEACLDDARSGDFGNDRERYYLAAAQIHATLAVAAATAMAAKTDYCATKPTPSPAIDVDPETGRDYAEEAWQLAEAEREGTEELAAEHYDAEEADAVREIRREMAVEAGDDSEAERQIAEDDARHERQAWLAERDAAEAEANDDMDLGSEYSDGYALPGEGAADEDGQF